MTNSSNALAATPPMGWNSWNTFGHHVEEALIRETADALISSGLKDCGYEYIVIDDMIRSAKVMAAASLALKGVVAL